MGLNLQSERGLEVLYKIAATADVFVTNKLPAVQAKLGIDEQTLKSVAPNIIYVQGTGQGAAGPDADKGSYDGLAFWARSGAPIGQIPEGGRPTDPPAPAFGDSIGAMTIAGGIMGALFHRERTGEATSVDVSLLGTGLWSMGAAIALSLQLDTPWRGREHDAPVGNPLTNLYQTKDNRYVSLSCLQAAKYWPEAAALIAEQPDLATDERFVDAGAIAANSADACAILAGAFAGRTLAEWKERLEGFSGQWAVVQDTLEVVSDPQTIANGYLQDYETSAGTPFQLVAPPVRFGGQSGAALRAPEFNEHGDSILEDLGLDWDEIVELKVANVVP